MNAVHVQDLEDISYQEAWDYQEALLKKGLDVKARRFAKDFNPKDDTIIENHLLFCQHPHVYTLGKSGAMENLLVNNKQLQDIGATFFKTNRGGDITYHGPGQMVVYPVLDLEQFFTDLGRYMRTLEEAVIQTIAEFGIAGGRLEGATGVWLDSEDPAKARKICAMGVKCSRWLTIHGIALNINTDLSYFGHIVPCGIADKGVTSMEKELGHTIDEAAVKKIFKEKFASVFNVNLN